MKVRVLVPKNGDVTETVKTLVEQVRQGRAEPGQRVLHTKEGKVLKCVTITGVQSRVEQSYGEQLNINNILEPAIRKGLLRHGITFEGEYDDIPVGDFMEAQVIVAKGKSMFEALPAAIRAKFEGKPEKFMAFVQDPANEKWLRDNGMLKGLDGLDSKGNITEQQKARDQMAADEAARRAAEKVEHDANASDGKA